jgi:glucosamine--fructose-6-phosphate aminotransferase (isomerizing)
MAKKRLTRCSAGDEVRVYRFFGGCPPVATIDSRVTKSIAICVQNPLQVECWYDPNEIWEVLFNYVWNHGLYRQRRSRAGHYRWSQQTGYRGYDSAGISFYQNGRLQLAKKKGRLAELVKCLGEFPSAHLGIGHTRWATHGVPSDRTAHPHMDCSGRIALVHNGIIENYASLRKQLMLEGHDFVSETDTEIVAHLIEKFYRDCSLEAAVREALQHLKGSFAVAVISSDEPDKIIAAKKDSPLVVGAGNGENYLASDIPAILGKTNQVYIIEDNQFVILTKDAVSITDFSGQPVEKKLFPVTWDPIAAEKGGYEHFMLKEIHEQPTALRETLRGNVKEQIIDLGYLDIDPMFKDVEKIYIVACGTAYHAGLVGRQALEKLARIPVETDIASEFRYRDILWNPRSVMIVISQSGETADTLAVLREAKRQGIKVLAVTMSLAALFPGKPTGSSTPTPDRKLR